MKSISGTLFFTVALLFSACSPPLYPPPLSPDDALSHFTIHDSFKVELFAAEPFVMDPVELYFDGSGNMYVVEIGDYPDKPEKGQGKSRVRLLQDRDGDGRIDHSILVASGIQDATSVLRWKEGLIVTAAPDILYLIDDDGDHQTDRIDTLFTGFFEHNSEAQITNLRFNLDHWIYASNFGQESNVTHASQPAAPALNLRGADFRFRLDTGMYEPAAGPTQFGQSLDDAGNRFVTHNSTHISHLVMPWRFLHRNPNLHNKSALRNISDHESRMFQQTPPPYWRAERTRRRQAQYDAAGNGRVEHASNHFTGSSGGSLYDGDLFPEAFYGNVFTGEVAGNLVHRDVIAASLQSPTFVASRATEEQNREFLTSTDPWFRPASTTIGPDGALYIVDYYRQHIETPLSIPEDLKEQMDFFAGAEHGRIYRIVPRGTQPPPVSPDLRSQSDTELMEYLAHENGWWRRTAHQIMLERETRLSADVLVPMLENKPLANTRLRALYLLHEQNLLNADILATALKDTSNSVRKHAALLAGPYPELHPQLANMLIEGSPQVALFAAFTLGEFYNHETLTALSRFVNQYHRDPWMRKAVLTSETGVSLDLVQYLDQTNRFFAFPEESRVAFIKEWAASWVDAPTPESVTALLQLIARSNDLSHQSAWLEAALEGLTNHPMLDITSLDTTTVSELQTMADTASASLQKSIQALLLKSGYVEEAAAQEVQ